VNVKIVAIGGGEIRQRETLKIDRFIRDFSGQSSPTAVFIPTASYDAPGYCEVFSEVYGKELGCHCQNLLLHTETSSAEIEDLIFSSDIIYVGGGDTKTMLDVWKANAVIPLLKEAGERGAVLSGLSAGAVCWFDQGHSDFESFQSQSDWQYRLLPGLSFKSGVFCPHLDAENRLDSFQSLLAQTDMNGIGADNNAAVWSENDDSFQVITAHQNAKVTTLSHGRLQTWSDGEKFSL
jgi:dipeptidase E